MLSSFSLKPLSGWERGRGEGTFYERLIAAGKEQTVALIAVARKLLTILNAILRDGRPWREEAAAHA